MLYWYWIFLIYLTIVNRYGESRVVFPLSLCSFYDNSQRLNYSCHNGKENPKNKLNTLEVTEHLCGNYDEKSKGISCKNISLLFFEFQPNVLCVASSAQNVATIKQVFIKLPVNGVNHQHFLVCTSHEQLLRNYTFSCATDVDKMTELSLTVSGYDVPIDSIWTTMLKINITCIDTVDKDHKAGPVLLIIGGVVVVVSIIGGTILTAVIVVLLLIKWYNKRIKDTMSRRLYASTLIMNKVPGILPDPILIDSDASDISLPQTVATGSDLQQTNTTGGINLNVSVHQQDNSSEDTSISPLPKMKKYVIMPDFCVESWIESSL